MAIFNPEPVGRLLKALDDATIAYLMALMAVLTLVKTYFVHVGIKCTCFRQTSLLPQDCIV